MIFSINDSFTFTVTLILTIIVGLCVGSFLNVVIYRLPNGMKLYKPASHCPNCNYKLKWYDNIPLLSYIILGGKCRNCKKHITFRYTIVELANALLWTFCLLLFRSNVFYAIISAIACSVCICVFFIDLEHMIIFDRFQIVMAVLGIISIFLDCDFKWYSHLIGGGVALVIFLLVDLVMSKMLKKDALGGGDIKFVAVCGLFLGWQKFIIMMLLASIVGSIVMLILKKKNGESKEIPFGPFLTSGFIVSMLLGNFILNWYLSFFAF